MKIVAIDIGGTEIKGFLMNPSKLKEHRVKTDLSKGKDTILRSLFDVIDFLFEDDVQAVSIVTAGTIDTETMTIIDNLGTMPGWLHLNLGAMVKERYNCPVFVDNDANGAMIGEMQHHLDSDIKNAVMITLGTGVGTALYLSGKLYRGSSYRVEFGHTVLHPQGILCTCGRQGCAEQYVSGSALTRKAKQELDAQMIHGSKFFEYLKMSHPKALKIWMSYIDDLAIFIQNINQVIDPEIFIIGGGLIHSKEFLLPSLEKALSEFRFQKTIHPAIHGNNAGILGAYHFALERLSHHE